MLASDDFIDSGNSLEFSLASDIIELVIFTTDDLFMQTLREAVGGSRRLWHVPSADKVSDMLLAGQVGILVLDVHALTGSVGAFIAMIKRQFPKLVLVVAGQRGAESELAALISSGTVYRFIHKPMSPGRAKLFAEAACRKYEEQRRQLPVSVGRIASAKSPVLTAGLAAAVALAVLAAWGALHRGASQTQEAATLDRLAPAAAARPDAPAATAGQPAPTAGSTDTLDRSASQGAVDSAKDKLRLATAKPKPREPAPAAEDRLSRALSRVDARIKEDRLIDPDYDNARYYLQEALLIDPKGDATLGARQTLAGALLAAARGAIDRRDLTYAGRLIDAASGIAAPTNLENARQLLRAAQERSAKSVASTTDPATPPTVAPTAATAASIAPDPPPVQASQPIAAPSIAALSPAPAASSDRAVDIIAAKDLTLVKSVRPQYPPRAEQLRTEGWVELDFTVAETGDVRDISVHAANPAGLFDKAAESALAQWRYLPVLKDAKPVPQRSRIRIRFTLPG